MSISYRRAERFLYTYPEKLRDWQAALLEYAKLKESSDVHAQRYTDNHMSVGQVSDPAGDYVNRLLTLERRIARDERAVRLVNTLRSKYFDSPDERDRIKLEILERYYFEGESMKDIAAALEISERTLYRRRQELVHEVIKERMMLTEAKH